MGDQNGKQRAEELFNEFLRRCESGEEISIQEFCLEHSDVKDVLLGLYSLHCSPDGPAVLSGDLDDVVDPHLGVSPADRKVVRIPATEHRIEGHLVMERDLVVRAAGPGAGPRALG